MSQLPAVTPTRKPSLDAMAIIIMLACCAFWGAQQVLIKATLAELPPVFQASVRFIIATALLLVWSRARGIALTARDGSLRAGLLVGALFAAEFACIYLGMQFTTASRLTIFVYTAPFFVALFLPMYVPSERLRAMQWLGLICAFCAIVLAFGEGFIAGGERRDTWRGDALALTAGALWGLTTVAIRATGLTRVAPEKLLFYQIGASALALPLLSLAMGERWQFSAWSGFAIASIAAQSVIGAFASYLAWMWLLGRYPATQLASFSFLTPVFALVAAALWLSEPITFTIITALALVALGIVLVNRRG